jgi:hypothetical protein
VRGAAGSAQRGHHPSRGALCGNKQISEREDAGRHFFLRYPETSSHTTAPSGPGRRFGHGRRILTTLARYAFPHRLRNFTSVGGS